jgi:hypothetical protein
LTVERALEDEDDKLVADYKYFRIEKLLGRRPFIIQDIKIYQNPNEVAAWL